MFKKITSIVFTILFLAIITAPSIIMVVDDTVDISVFYSLSEEEEEEEVIDMELIFYQYEDEFIAFTKKERFIHLGYHFKKYSKPHLNFISPPPDFI